MRQVNNLGYFENMSCTFLKSVEYVCMDNNVINFQCGHVALVGLPNAGKSTLLNALLDVKVSITSHKPQTTRNSIVGIKTTEDYQIVFVDTPGYHAGRGRLNRAMVNEAENTIASVDLICVIADPNERGGQGFKALIEKCSATGVPMLLVLTKTDDRSKEELYKAAENLSALAEFKEVVPVSAKQKRNLDVLEKLIASYLPETPAIYPEDEITTQPEKFLTAEFVREQVFSLLNQEVPYDILVETEKVEDISDKRMEVSAVIIVSREGQKAIVIGKGGTMIKEIGTRARKEMQNFFGVKVTLNLWVKVKENWADKDEYLRIQGLS